MNTSSTISLPRRGPIGIFEPSADRLAELNRWFEEEYRSLLRFAHFVTGERTAAEDVVQDAFVRIYKAGPRLNRGEFKAYARKTIVNLSRSAHQRKATERRVTQTVTPELTTQQPDVGTADEVWSAIMSLSPKQRAVIALRYYEGLNEAEIAAALSMSAGSVKRHADRAMTKLRALLGEGRTS